MPEQQEQIPDEYLKAIGRFTVEWNQLESMLDLCLIRLLGKSLTDPRSHIVFTHMAFPQKTDAFKALLSEVLLAEGSLLTKYSNELQPLLKVASEARNRVIHSKWGVENGQVFRSTIRARGNLKMTMAPVSLAELSAECDHIANTSEAIFSAVTESASPQIGQ